MRRLIFSMCWVVMVLTCGSHAYAFDWLKSENSDTRDGNAFLKKKENAKALASYDNAAKKLPNRGEVHLNRGLALSRQGDDKLDEAMQAFTLAADSDAPRPVLARAEFNLGNAFLKKEDYKAAIDHYKKSLMLKPGNRDAAWNLEVARLKKKQQDEQQKENQDKQDQQDQGEDGDSGDQDKQDQQEQQDKQDKQDQQKQDQQNGQDQQDKQDKQDQDKQDQQKQDQQKQDEAKQKEQEEQQKQQQDQQKDEPQQAAPQNKSMEQMLNALDKQDNDFHKNKARQGAVGVPANVKDW